MVSAKYAYGFGHHYWKMTVDQTLNFNFYNEDATGLIQVGVMPVSDVEDSNNKVMGPTMTYSSALGKFDLWVYLNADLRTLVVYSKRNPKGEKVSDLPIWHDYLPAIQNRSSKQKNSCLTIKFEFDLEPYVFDEDENIIFEQV